MNGKSHTLNIENFRYMLLICPRLLAKVAKTAKKKQPATIHDEDDADEETDVNDDSEQTKSDNDGDDLTHPNLSSYKADDEEEEKEKENNDKVSYDHRVYTPLDHQLTDEEENQEGDEEVKEGEEKQEEEEELYRDLNINWKRIDAEMTDDQQEMFKKTKSQKLLMEYYYADHMNAIIGMYTKLDAVTNLQCDYLESLEKYEGLETELSKSKMISKSFESVQKHAINLELELQQCQEKIKNDKSFKVNQTKDFCKEREQYFEIQDLKAQLQDKGIVISELKKLIKKQKGKSVDTNFEKLSVIRQPNAFKSQRPLVLGNPTTFSNSFVRKDFSKSTSVTQTHVSNDFSKPVTAQTLPPNKKSILKNTNVLAPGIPQLKSNPQGDRVMHKNSQGKKQEVEDQRRNVKLSKNKTSVTACNDSLNAKTLNVKSVCATCDTCVLIDKHDMNDQIAHILGYGDLVQGAITIKRVYYVEGLNHNLFSVGQFCDADLEVAFRKSTCFIRDLKGHDLLTDGENLDKMKEKGDECIFVGYSTQSRAYRVFNKRTRVIMESIHVNFDELPLMTSDQLSSDPAPEYRTVSTSKELDLLYSLMFDELLNGSSKVVSKSFAVSAADDPLQR
nr:Gag-Pol polyprotein [Tanacetum cinerariifolium]